MRGERCDERIEKKREGDGASTVGDLLGGIKKGEIRITNAMDSWIAIRLHASAAGYW
jgi:hypothetical protein